MQSSKKSMQNKNARNMTDRGTPSNSLPTRRVTGNLTPIEKYGFLVHQEECKSSIDYKTFNDKPNVPIFKN